MSKKRHKVLFLSVVFLVLLCTACNTASNNDAYSEVAPDTALPATTASLPDPSPPTLPDQTTAPTREPPPTPETSPTLPLSGVIIGIDPGHQAKGDSTLEPVAPGSDLMKAKVSSGTQGRFTRVPEYEVNLAVGLLLQSLLEEHGATVIMTREINDVNISNIERAQLFNEAGTDYALRLHCNGSDDSSIYGAFMLVPETNPFLEDCNRAAEIMIDSFCKATDAKNLGITIRSDLSGFNWCDRMVVLIEMGHMTNETEDYLLTDPDYQEKMAMGMLEGILIYFDAMP